MQDEVSNESQSRANKKARRKGFWLGMLAGFLTFIFGIVALGSLLEMLSQPSAVESTDLESPTFPEVIQSEIRWPLTDLDGSQLDLAQVDEDVIFVNIWAT